MQLTELLIPTYAQMLGALSAWLGKAREQLSTVDADAVLSARLAPDMFPLSTQIRFACVQAYEGVYRLAGEALPVLVNALVDEGRNGADQPGTLADATARIDETLAFLANLSPAALDAREGADVELALPMGLIFDLNGTQYARDWALAQFYFHIMTAYSILRHNGVALGKADYVGHMFVHLRNPQNS